MTELFKLPETAPSDLPPCPFCKSPAQYDNRHAGYIGCSAPQSVCHVSPSIRGDYSTDIIAAWKRCAQITSAVDPIPPSNIDERALVIAQRVAQQHKLTHPRMIALFQLAAAAALEESLATSQ